MQKLRQWFLQSISHPWIQHIHEFMAPLHDTTNLKDKLYASIGGFLGILAVAIISHEWAPPESAWLMTASIGASAVLVFAAPHGPMSQPWPVLGSHMVSAIVGITLSMFASQYLDSLVLIAAAISLSILGMHLLRCLHPPGGATALTVIFAAQSHQMGTIDYHFLIFPLLPNLLILVISGILFHALSRKPYPVYFAKKRFKNQNHKLVVNSELPLEEFLRALSEIDGFVDINTQELKRILELAQLGSEAKPITSQELKVGAYYSNGELGKSWSVRQVREIVEDDLHHNKGEYVIFVRKAGKEKVKTDCVSRSDFANWAAYEVEPVESGWKRVTSEKSN